MQQNFDSAELAKFEAIAAHWWDPNGEVKTLHQINPLRLGFIKEKIDLNQLSVLDVGCGGGILSESLALCGASVTGIDLNPALIEVARLHQYESGTNVQYLVSSVEALAEKHRSTFDLVTCFELLEHVPDPKAIIAACSQLLKPNGSAFFSTLNRNLKSYCFAILGAEYVLKLLPKNTHDFARFIKPSELSTWLRLHGLSLQDLKGIIYNPLTKAFKLNDDVAVNYLCFTKKVANHEKNSSHSV